MEDTHRDAWDIVAHGGDLYTKRTYTYGGDIHEGDIHAEVTSDKVAIYNHKKGTSTWRRHTHGGAIHTEKIYKKNMGHTHGGDIHGGDINTK